MLIFQNRCLITRSLFPFFLCLHLAKINKERRKKEWKRKRKKERDKERKKIETNKERTEERSMKMRMNHRNILSIFLPKNKILCAILFFIASILLNQKFVNLSLSLSLFLSISRVSWWKQIYFVIRKILNQFVSNLEALKWNSVSILGKRKRLIKKGPYKTTQLKLRQNSNWPSNCCGKLRPPQ